MKRASFALAFTQAVLMASAQAEFFTRPFENHYESYRRITLNLSPKYLTSEENFNSTGTKVRPSGLTQYSRMDFDALARFGISERFSAFARLSWGKISIQRAAPLGSQFGLLDQSVGATYRIFKPNTPTGTPTTKQAVFTLDGQLQIDFPGYTKPTPLRPDSAWLGDGTKDFTLGTIANLTLDPSSKNIWMIQAGGGVTFRTDDFSRSLPWSIFLHHVPYPEGFRFQLGAYGIVSAKTDLRIPGDALRPTTGSSGSFFVNAVNPSIMVGRLALGYQLKGGSALLVGTQQPFWGQSAPKYMQFFANYQFALSDPSGSRSQQSPEDYGRSNKGFVDYSFEAKVTRMNDRLNLIKIDKGTDQSVNVGDKFDIFQIKKDGSPSEAVARATCTSVKPNEAALTITEYYKEIWIEEGFVAKRPTY